jgi:Flp pilus assembly protein TadB
MFTAIIMAVGAAAAAIGGAVKGAKAKRAAKIDAKAQEDARILQMAQQRLAERGQRWDQYTQAVLAVQQKAQKRQQIIAFLSYGLPLLAGIFLLIAVRMPKRKKRKKRKGKKK